MLWDFLQDIVGSIRVEKGSIAVGLMACYSLESFPFLYLKGIPIEVNRVIPAPIVTTTNFRLQLKIINVRSNGGFEDIKPLKIVIQDCIA